MTVTVLVVSLHCYPVCNVANDMLFHVALRSTNELASR
jgi:hypothetical protein